MALNERQSTNWKKMFSKYMIEDLFQNVHRISKLSSKHLSLETGFEHFSKEIWMAS